MKDYKLLLNQTYLYLKQYPDKREKINFSKIANAVGLTRQTVSKEYSQIKEEDWDRINIRNFYNDKNKYERAMLILKDVEDNNYDLTQMAQMLGTSRSNISKYYNKEIYSAVYACFYDNNLIYVGSTSDYLSRIQQHWSCINGQDNNKKLYEYLKNLDKNKIEFRPIMTNIEKQEYLRWEQALIKTFQPICNIEFI